MSRELQTLNQQNKLDLWEERVSAYQDSDFSIKCWCNGNDICESAYYWKEKSFYSILSVFYETF